MLPWQADVSSPVDYCGRDGGRPDVDGEQILAGTTSVDLGSQCGHFDDIVNECGVEDDVDPSSNVTFQVSSAATTARKKKEPWTTIVQCQCR